MDSTGGTFRYEPDLSRRVDLIACGVMGHQPWRKYPEVTCRRCGMLDPPWGMYKWRFVSALWCD